jgi:hypothetical protein
MLSDKLWRGGSRRALRTSDASSRTPIRSWVPGVNSRGRFQCASRVASSKKVAIVTMISSSNISVEF